jgi:D-alanyl-D-alanine carboxypeptidase/D-alanyl-D-alanine-endopeptidase (penicillin-binding protein 4)
VSDVTTLSSIIDGQAVGGGDPVLATPEYGTWVYPARPRTPIEELADRLVDAGLTRIDGDVLATAPGFSGPRVPDGWPDRYFASFDARYSDGLTVDAGLRTIVTYPEPDEDGEADPDGEADDSEEPERPRDLEELGPPDVRVEHADAPALQAASELIRLLQERDIEVVGGPVEGEPDGLLVGRLAAVESPPMLGLLRFAMQRSDNHLTDGLFRLAARARTGDGSFEAGDRALRQVLDRYEIDHEGAVFADGSGLSRDDRASARLLVEIDRAMTSSRHGPAWASIMASMGESGTLERRLRGTVAEARFVGKTGTLRDVTALSGAVLDADGPRYHLAVVANDPGATRGVARAFADELILLLVADVDACSIDRPGETDGPIGLPALQVAC